MKRILVIFLSLLSSMLLSAQESNYWSEKGDRYFSSHMPEMEFHCYENGEAAGETNSAIMLAYCYMWEHGCRVDYAKTAQIIDKWSVKTPKTAYVAFRFWLPNSYYGGYFKEFSYRGWWDFQTAETMGLKSDIDKCVKSAKYLWDKYTKGEFEKGSSMEERVLRNIKPVLFDVYSGKLKSSTPINLNKALELAKASKDYSDQATVAYKMYNANPTEENLKKVIKKVDIDIIKSYSYRLYDENWRELNKDGYQYWKNATLYYTYSKALDLDEQYNPDEIKKAYSSLETSQKNTACWLLFRGNDDNYCIIKKAKFYELWIDNAIDPEWNDVVKAKWTAIKLKEEVEKLDIIADKLNKNQTAESLLAVEFKWADYQNITKSQYYINSESDQENLIESRTKEIQKKYLDYCTSEDISNLPALIGKARSIRPEADFYVPELHVKKYAFNAAHYFVVEKMQIILSQEPNDEETYQDFFKQCEEYKNFFPGELKKMLTTYLSTSLGLSHESIVVPVKNVMDALTEDFLAKKGIVYANLFKVSCRLNTMKDQYALYRASKITINSTKEEIDEVLNLEMTKDMLKTIKPLLKKSFLKEKAKVAATR